MRVRPFVDGDYGRLVAFQNSAFPDRPRTEAQARAQDASVRNRGMEIVRLLCTDADHLVGVGQVAGKDASYLLHLAVDPRQRRRGAGTALWEALLAALRARGARLVRTPPLDAGSAECIAFLTRRGFVEVERAFRYVLDLADFDPARFGDAEERPTRGGLAFMTFVEAAAGGPGALRALHELHNACRRDQPPREDHAEPIPFEAWQAHFFQGSAVLAPGSFVAVDGARYVGLSTLERDGPPVAASLSAGFTGVHREYRGRGIALALKLRTIRWAREQGYARISTGHNSENVPMVRLSARLGFRRESSLVRLGRWLDDAGDAASRRR
ncbi:MAG TPA: GNAT family N-acetyltransferase [Chloroflexota bacterium]|nr:GNAT family N-acetyltransferase [Chloroflexota bacterium]